LDFSYTLSAIANILALSALVSGPLIFAAIVSWYPGNRPSKKFYFTLVSGALSYGCGIIVFLLFFPFSLVKFEVYEYDESGEFHGLAAFSRSAEVAGEWAALVACIVASVAIPILMRNRFWMRIVADET